MRIALIAALLLHAGAIALLVLYGAPRPLADPDSEPAGIVVVFSAGGGGEQEGTTDAATAPSAPVPAETEAEGEQQEAASAEETPREEVTTEAAPAEPTPREAEAPPSEAAALPLPPPPPPEPPPPAAREPLRAPPSSPSSRGAASRSPGAQEQDGQSAATEPGAAGLLVATRQATVGRRVDPVVPIEAREARMQGTVVLAVTVSPEGVPAAVDVLRSSGHFMLDRAAQEALWQWRFDPARRGGVPVEERIAIPITFRIVD